MIRRSNPSPVLLQLQGVQGSAGSMGQAEEETHPCHPKPNEMGPGVPLWAGEVVSRGWMPWQGTRLQAWAAVSVARGRSGCSGYNTGLVSGRKRMGTAPSGHPKCIFPLQTAPTVGGLCPREDLSSHEALSFAGRDLEHVNTFHTSA